MELNCAPTVEKQYETGMTVRVSYRAIRARFYF